MNDIKRFQEGDLLEGHRDICRVVSRKGDWIEIQVVKLEDGEITRTYGTSRRKVGVVSARRGGGLTECVNHPLWDRALCISVYANEIHETTIK